MAVLKHTCNILQKIKCVNMNHIILKFNLYLIFQGSWCPMSPCNINVLSDREEDGNCVPGEFRLYFDDVVNYLAFVNIHGITGFI